MRVGLSKSTVMALLTYLILQLTMSHIFKEAMAITCMLRGRTIPTEETKEAELVEGLEKEETIQNQLVKFVTSMVMEPMFATIDLIGTFLHKDNLETPIALPT